MPLIACSHCCNAVTFTEWLALLESVLKLWATYWWKPLKTVIHPRRRTEPLPELQGGRAAVQCRLLLKGLGRVCLSQIACLNSHQPKSSWKMGLEMNQLTGISAMCSVLNAAHLLGGDSNRNDGCSPSPKSFFSRPRGYCTARLQRACCFFWATSVLFTVFSV